jgi:hypothetical protein
VGAVGRGVIVAYLHPGTVTGEFCRSLLNVSLAYPGLIGGQIAQYAGANISRARNEVAESFLSTDFDWLWMLDSDMTFPPDALPRLLAAVEVDERPIVGGLCFAAMHGPDGYRMFPTMYEFGPDGLAVLKGYPENTVVRVEATGAACLLVHRTVFEQFPEGGPFRWFAETITEDGERTRGEDVTFCKRLMDLDIPLYVHTGVKTGHVKQIVLDEDRYREQEASWWRSPMATAP